ncbi:MAG: CGNR zinc finger domain-containing protein [Spirochaetota bacterium]
MNLLHQSMHNCLHPFILVGNRICIDFANTAFCYKREAGQLYTFQDILAFYETTSILTKEESKYYQKLKLKDSSPLEDAFSQIVSFRSVIISILEKIFTQRSVSNKEIQIINHVLKSYEGYYKLQRSKQEYILKYELSNPSMENLLVPAAYSLSQFMQNDDFSLFKRCANPECGIFYYDVSPQKNRIWCSSKVCGNRAKARSFSQKKKQIIHNH